MHWFADVVGRLVLGWAWFALCSIAFGRRLLRFALRSFLFGAVILATTVNIVASVLNQ